MKLIYCRPEFLHVQHRHIYLHSRTCTHSGLCRWPSILVAFHICYLLDCASIHDIPALVIMILVFPVYIRYIHPLWRSWVILYCTWWWPHMTFVYHAYSWLLYSYVSVTSMCIFVVICIDLSLYYTGEWLVLPPRSALLHFWDGYNVFRPSCYPSDLIH